MKKIIYLTGLYLISIYPIGMAQESVDFPNHSGWDLSTDFPVYSPDNLWDYINGAADGYLTYGFRNLYMAEYTKGKHNIKVEVYVHKDSNNAFGIYSAERSPDYDFLDIGVQGYQTGGALNYFSGIHYIKMHTDSDKKSVHKAMKAISLKLSENLNGSSGFPAMLNYFPEKGKLPHHQRFIAKNYLGHEFFNEVFTANYEINDQEFTLFLSKKSSPKECKMLIRNYMEFTGQNFSPVEEGLFLIKDRYNGDIPLIWERNFIYGIYDCEDVKLIEEYLEKMDILVKP